MRVLGYGRVSTEDQAVYGASLDAQRENLWEWCNRKNAELVDFVADEGYSAKDLDRPGVIELLERLDAGEADVLLVTKLDRLSRSVLDFANLMSRSRMGSWSIVCLDVGVDTSTASGEVVANVLASFAQFERRLISERTKAALAVKKAQGVHCGRPRVVPDEVRERVAALRNDGMTFRDIADLFNEERVPTGHGGKQWWGSSVRSVVCAR